MATKITNSFPALQAEAGKYRSTASSTEREIVEVWNYAIGFEADKAIMISMCGLISTPLSGIIMASQSVMITLSIYGGPIAAKIMPVALLPAAFGLAVSVPMIASIAANTIGITRLFRSTSVVITTKQIDDAASLQMLPKNPRIRKRALQLIREQGRCGARLSAIKYKPSFIGRYLNQLAR